MKQALQLVLRGYKRFISPMLPNACRFTPTCSEYAMEALELHGLLRGSLLGIVRLARCHPFARAGFDPVPPPAPAQRQDERARTRFAPHAGEVKYGELTAATLRSQATTGRN